MRNFCPGNKDMTLDCGCCTVGILGHCKEMTKALSNIVAALQSLPKMEAEAIFDNVIDAIMKGADRFRGWNEKMHCDAFFSSWVMKVFRNKKADYFRDYYRKINAETKAALKDRQKKRRPPKEERRSKFLRRWVKSNGTSFCARIFRAELARKDYNAERPQGTKRKTQIEIAPLIGLTHDNYRQWLVRCFNDLKLEYEEWKAHWSEHAA